MRKPPFVNLAVFILFFGLALFEIVAERDWIEAAFFAAIGILCLRTDFRKKS